MWRPDTAPGDTRVPPGQFADHTKLDGFSGAAFATRVRQACRVLCASARDPALRGLATAWFTVFGLAVATGGVLQALGPPRAGAADDAGRPVAVAPLAGEMRAASRQAAAKPQPGIAVLLARVEREITDSPDGPPPAADAAATLQRVAEALPTAAAPDRELANNMASDLYDRAKIALNDGKIDEEQRWLALGSILAPPPDLTPSAPELAAQQQAGPETSGAPAAESRQDITPNETEAEIEPAPTAQAAAAVTPTRQARLDAQPATDRQPQSDQEAAVPAVHPDSGAAGTRAAEASQERPEALSPPPLVAERAEPGADGGADPAGAGSIQLPALRPPGARPPALAAADGATQEAPSATEPTGGSDSNAASDLADPGGNDAAPRNDGETAKRSSVATVAGFYAALRRGDGFAAQEFLVPEKRGHGHFAPTAMSRFYGSLPEPLTLIGANDDGANHVTAQYRFRSRWGACNGSAEIDLRDDMIASITAKHGC